MVGFSTGLDTLLDAELASGSAALSVNSSSSLTKPPGYSLLYKASIRSGSALSSELKGESTCFGEDDVLLIGFPVGGDVKSHSALAAAAGLVSISAQLLLVYISALGHMADGDKASLSC